MIAIIDYKAGNLTSVVKALRYLGADDIVVTQSPDDVRRADKIVLPGVGHFQSTQLLQDLGLTDATRERIAAGTPFLGICVGLQWLYEGSTEAQSTDGLCHFGSMCERFPATFDGAELKSPHVGWNSLEDIRPDSRLLRGIVPGSFVYYTHSWRAPLSADTAATTSYGGPFTAAVERDNVMGVQFHPEKSSAIGLQVLKNFLGAVGDFMQIDYVVTYPDFVASMKAYRRRAGRVLMAHCADLFLLPAIGLFLVGVYLYFYFTEGSHGTEGIGYAPWIGAMFIVGGPLLRKMRMRQLYKQRTVLSADGSTSAELDDTAIRFILKDKLDVRYSWDAFSDYAENDGVVTLFVQKSAFHTIPRRGLSDVQWAEFMQFVTAHVKKR